MLVQHAESVVVVAVVDDLLLVVRQHRGGPNDVTVELPSGKVDAGEGPDDAAPRELAEECGVVASRWRRLGAFWAAPAYSTEFVHVFEASDLAEAPPPQGDAAEDEIEAARIPLDGAESELSDAVSIAALALWRERAPS